MVGDSLEDSQQVASHVAKIITSLAQVLTFEFLESVQELLTDLVHGPFGVDLLVADSLLDSIEKRCVFQEQGLCFEDGRKTVAQLLMGPLTSCLQLSSSFLGGIPKTRDFAFYITVSGDFSAKVRASQRRTPSPVR